MVEKRWASSMGLRCGKVTMVPTETSSFMAIAARTVQESSYWNSSHIQICSNG